MEEEQFTISDVENLKEDNWGVEYDEKNKFLSYAVRLVEKHYCVLEGTKIILNSAFNNCPRLVSLELPESLIKICEKAFRDCENLEYITLPKALVEIDDFAFKNCEKLTSIYLPASVEILGVGIFNGCSNIQSFEIDKLNKSFVIESGVIYNIDKTAIITTIPSLIEPNLTISENVRKINDCSFINCENLNSIEIPNQLEEIGEFAFDGCLSLHKVNLPDNIKSLGAYCFAKTSICKITIPLRVKFIDIAPFSGCYNLTEINVDIQNQYFKSINGVLFSISGNSLIEYPSGSQLREYATPQATLEIMWGAFRGSRHLEKITLTNKITHINNAAFYECRSLYEVKISSNVSIIKDCVFGDCSKLEIINLPKKLLSIKSYAFENCTNLKELTVPSKLELIEESAFLNCNKINFKVSPKNLKFKSFEGKLFESHSDLWGFKEEINNIVCPF